MAEHAEKTSIWIWVVLVIVAGAIVLGAGLTLLVPKDVVVPSLVGKPADAARAALKKVGLTASVDEEFSVTVPDKNVIEQRPKAGSIVRAGSAVRITVSKGPQLIKVPNLANMTREDAGEKLASVGLAVGDIIMEYNSDVEDDIVFRQVPAAGQMLPKGQAVNLFASKGAHTTTVPMVVGKGSGQARQSLANAGLNIETDQQPSTQESPGTVLSQSPPALSVVPVGTTVTIIVSTGPALVSVPNLKGLNQAYAMSLLQNAGLDVDTNYVPSSVMKVVRQEPEAGTQLRRGSTVTIWVGDGSKS